MRFRGFGSLICAVVIVLAVFVPAKLPAQTGSGAIHGQVTDPSGAAVPNATIAVTTPTGTTLSAKTNNTGAYTVKGLDPGTYAIKASATGFQDYQNAQIQVAPGQDQKADIRLEIQTEQQQVEVTDNPVALSVSPEENAGAIVLSGKDIDALPDDPDELQSDLEALAGPSIGPNGGQMYIDGFTAGQLPPKSSIREVRINQNPFSAEYDKLGYGRIEIFTKPGTDQFHGQFSVIGNDSAFNSRNPYLGDAPLPGYDTTQFNGNFGGPLNKNASFFIDVQRRDINNVAVINAQTLDPNFNIIPDFTQALSSPQTRTNIGPRLDYQLSTNNTLSLRYQFYRNTVTNDGVGQYALATQGYNLVNTEHTVQLSDTQVFGGKIVNETHFQYLRDDENQLPQAATPTISVPFEFTSGGNNLGAIVDSQNHYEFQNYTSMNIGKHFLKFGARLRDFTETNSSTANYNGNYVFRTLAAYQATALAASEGLPLPTGVNGPIQYAQTVGSPVASVNLFDSGVYVQDDYRWRPNITLSAGLRLESQTHISDHLDWAPRFAIAWGLGGGKAGTPKTVIRAGWGMFYDRFNSNLILQAERQNGITQQEYIVTNPAFFTPNTIQSATTLQSFATGVPTIYQIAPSLHAPDTLQTAISVERQVSKVMNMTVTYVNARGIRQLLTNNVNAPEISGVPAPTGIRPLGVLENLYQYQSSGKFEQNELIANFNVRAGPKLTLNGYYALNYANSDTSGASSFPSNPYNIAADYGRAGFDVRNRAFFGGTITLPYGIQLNPFMLLASGTPFNVTTGTDLYGTSILNARPAFVSATTCPVLTTVSANIACTQLGTFNSAPLPGQAVIPINAYTGPDQFSFNLRIARTFGLGPRKEAVANPAGGGGGRGGFGGIGRGGAGGGRGGGGGRGPGGGGAGGRQLGTQRYSITLSANIRNLFNVVNPSTPAGSLGSTRFDTSDALAGGAFGNNSAVRVIQLQAQFSF